MLLTVWKTALILTAEVRMNSCCFIFENRPPLISFKLSDGLFCPVCAVTFLLFHTHIITVWLQHDFILKTSSFYLKETAARDPMIHSLMSKQRQHVSSENWQSWEITSFTSVTLRGNGLQTVRHRGATWRPHTHISHYGGRRGLIRCRLKRLKDQTDRSGWKRRAAETNPRRRENTFRLRLWGISMQLTPCPPTPAKLVYN